MINSKEGGWNLDNSYLNLSGIFYSEVDIRQVSQPNLIIFNEKLAEKLGLNTKIIKSEKGIGILGGNTKIQDGAYIAQAYAGHQFGHFTMLGDGRALLIGEQITPSQERYDIQLKGSGRTPYSRRGDGRAVLGPMLREYIISEALYGLGIPTTRSLAVVKTGEVVNRENESQGAILARVASSHIRFGTFQFAGALRDKDKIKELADYSIDRHYPNIEKDNNKYLNFLKAVIKSQAYLVAKWQSVGFIHGVMNTDNMTISGESIDFGPCAFMDFYNPETVFSSIDIEGRYSYKNQPKMTHWNLCRFAETLIPLLNKDKEIAVEMAQEAISDFSKIYNDNWISNMGKKLGIFDVEKQDEKIIEKLLKLMEKYKEDYTNTFLALTFDKNKNSDMYNSEEFKRWYDIWQESLERQGKPKVEVMELMKNNNPAVIPRNHRVEEALKAANNGNFDIMYNLIAVISSPYKHSKEQEEYSKLPKNLNCSYRTFCGT